MTAENRAHPLLPITFVILVNLLIGLFVAADYGQSWDEHLRYRYAERSLAAYTGQAAGVEDEKGPFYVMVARLGVDVMRAVRGDLPAMQAWHWMNFLSFQLGLFFLYQLCRRWMSLPAALGVTLLFNTQPLLWGHAWINPKDIPFMAFFLGSVTLGLIMANRLEQDGATARPAPAGDFREMFALDLERARSRRLPFVGGISLVSIALLVVAWSNTTAVQDWLAALVVRAYQDGSSTFLGTIFLQLAQQAKNIPVNLYAEKARLLVPLVLRGYAGLTLALHGGLAVWLLPNSARWLWRERALPYLRSAASSLARRDVLLAGAFLGFASAIRVLGPFSGVLVGLYALARAGRKAASVLTGYFVVGLLVTYISWPGLWGAPVDNYLQSFSAAADFPWEGKVMFGGVDYAVGALPRGYLPILLGLQFTETAMLVMLAGLLVGAAAWRRHPELRAGLGLLAAWFAVPLTAAVVLQPTIYDNFRQFLFLSPPLFVLSGLGLQAIYRRLRIAWRYALFVVILLLPGIFACIQLHPYQYVYYNALVGGTAGAFRRYEMDYWATSYEDATEYLNRTAPQGSIVVVWGADHLVSAVARPDLQVQEYRKAGDWEPDAAVYAVLSTRHDKDLSLYPDAEVLYQVSRAGAVFAVVKQLQPGSAAQP